MRARADRFGLFVPGSSPIHRAPLWAKYLAVLAIGAAALVWRIAPVAVGLTALTVLLYALAGRHVLSRWAWPLKHLWWMFAILGVHQWWLAGGGLAGLWHAVGIVGSMLAALQAARLLLLSTEQADLLDGLARALAPLRRLGVDADAVTLALHVMLRSIPALAGAAGDVTDAATARGLRRNPLVLAGPVVVSAVGYAHRTADALAARGLMDRDDDAA
ncbi:energy-coupling factor transporter transmembrane protein EcfT [Zhihengliuella sp.]|uniref:energy-coupling factor transporter transmembrane protein EcfT n=1 Tax=Zhihengliuella sp. TaxID=1954483 RepID=UPI00281130EF|nr:energy-coupling factor transporter transmembrane protein EcfT [Zhihengliuella sp.]